MKVPYEGQVYDFDLLRVSTEELRQIKIKLAMTPKQFLGGIAEADVEAMLALKWVVLRSDGQHDDLVLDAADPFPDYWQFLEAWTTAEARAPEPEPDPTPAGFPPATSTPESSESSPLTPSSSAATTPSPSPDGAESESGRSDDSLSQDSSVTSPA